MTKQDKQFFDEIYAKFEKLTPHQQKITRIAFRRVIDNFSVEPAIIEDIDVIIRKSSETLAEIEEIGNKNQA